MMPLMVSNLYFVSGCRMRSSRVSASCPKKRSSSTVSCREGLSSMTGCIESRLVRLMLMSLMKSSDTMTTVAVKLSISSTCTMSLGVLINIIPGEMLYSPILRLKCTVPPVHNTPTNALIRQG